MREKVSSSRVVESGRKGRQRGCRRTVQAQYVWNSHKCTDDPTKTSKLGRERQTPCDNTYLWNLNMTQMKQRVCAQLCPTLCDLMDCSLPGSSVRGIYPGKNTGVGCHFLLQGIILTQESNPHLPHLLHCRQNFTTESPKQKQTHRHRKQVCGCQGGGKAGEGWSGSLGLADANYYI